MKSLCRRSIRHRSSIIIVRLLFLCVFPILIAQMLVSHWYREPFPAIMMPRFTKQTVKDGVTVWKDVRITVQHEDGTLSIIDKNRLLDPMHLPQRNKVLHRIFRPESAAPNDPHIVAWLLRRVAAVTGRDDARRLHFTWFEVQADFGDPGRAEWDRPLGRLTLDMKTETTSSVLRNVEHIGVVPPGRHSLATPE